MSTILPVGSTPTLTFKFNKIPVDSIIVAYLTISQRGNIIIEMDITSMEFSTEDKTVSWTLTQEDTLKLKENTPTAVQVRYRTSDGFVGHSQKYITDSDEILKEGVI